MRKKYLISIILILATIISSNVYASTIDKIEKVEFNFNGKTLTIQCNEYDIIGQIFQKFAIKIGTNINSLTFLYNGDGNINRNLQINQVINNIDKNRNKMSVIVYDMNKSMISTYSNTSNNNTQFVYPNINYQNNINNNLRMQETIKKQQEMIKMDEAQIKTLKNQLNAMLQQFHY